MSQRPSSSSNAVRAFLLPIEQRERLREAGGPLADPDLSLDTLQWVALPVVEVNGRIAAYWPAFFGLHLEPLWIAEANRTSPGVARALLDLMALTLPSLGRPVAFAVVDPATIVLPLATRLGFARVPGDLYYVAVQPAPPAEGV